MGVIVGIVIVITILLHIGFFVVIRRLGKHESPPDDQR